MKENFANVIAIDLLQELTQYKETCKELNLIMDSTFDQITVTDGEGIFLNTSNFCEDIFGIPKSEMIGCSIYDLSKRKIFSPSITAEVLKNKKKLTIIQRTSAGKRLLVTGIPVFNENGKITRVINISKDITEFDGLKRQIEETENTLEWFQSEIKKDNIKDKKFIVGNSKQMIKIMQLIEHVNNMDTTIILLGETGVGKSFIAKTIHQMSKRREQPFVHINCGAIPENLIESEFFGYEEGAFTGAIKNGKKGLFEAAGEGTIFLDEIGELPINLQVKLLHVLQEKQAYRIGSTKPFNINARIISATNKDLKKLIMKGKFREDLYYRLNIVPINIPALRDRREDISLFIKNFLEKNNIKYNFTKQISLKAYNLLTSYNWPGNIRELENTIERLVVTCNTDIIEESCVCDIITQCLIDIYEIDDIVSLKNATEEFEKQILLKAVEKYRTTRKVAQVLKIDQSTVVKKLKKIRENNISDD